VMLFQQEPDTLDLRYSKLRTRRNIPAKKRIYERMPFVRHRGNIAKTNQFIWPLQLSFWLSFPKGICFCFCSYLPYHCIHNPATTPFMPPREYHFWVYTLSRRVAQISFPRAVEGAPHLDSEMWVSAAPNPHRAAIHRWLNIVSCETISCKSIQPALKNGRVPHPFAPLRKGGSLKSPQQ